MIKNILIFYLPKVLSRLIYNVYLMVENVWVLTNPILEMVVEGGTKYPI